MHKTSGLSTPDLLTYPYGFGDPPTLSELESKFSGQFDGSELTKLYHHIKKPEWGVGVAFKEADGKVDIQFEDGKARRFSRDFYHFIETADRPADKAQELVAELQSMAPKQTTSKAKKSSGVGRKTTTKPVLFKEQGEHFLELFPAGFSSDRYKQEHRMRTQGSQLKKHRDKFITTAQTDFAVDAFAGEPALLFKQAVKLVNSTDLISAKERKAFAAILPIHHEQILKSLLTLLHGDSSVENRLDGFILAVRRGLGEYPTWTIVTYFLGLFHPAQYPIVTRDTYRKQAAGIAPNLDIPKKPTGKVFRKIVEMMEGLRAAMSEHPALTPTDLIDVQNFIALTLKPKGRKAILDKRPKADTPPAPAPS